MFWAALTTAAMAEFDLIVGVTTPARSGPNRMTDCITAPYTDVAARPRDYPMSSGRRPPGVRKTDR